MAKINDLEGIKKNPNDFSRTEALWVFKWGEQDHHHWKDHDVYRGYDNLQVTSDEEWKQFYAALGDFPVFWTPQYALADRLYRRMGALLKCKRKKGSTGWWPA